MLQVVVLVRGYNKFPERKAYKNRHMNKPHGTTKSTSNRKQVRDSTVQTAGVMHNITYSQIRYLLFCEMTNDDALKSISQLLIIPYMALKVLLGGVSSTWLLLSVVVTSVLYFWCTGSPPLSVFSIASCSLFNQNLWGHINLCGGVFSISLQARYSINLWFSPEEEHSYIVIKYKNC